MKDKLSEEVMEQVNKLPLQKKKALLEFLKSDILQKETQSKINIEHWKQQLLKTSVWSEADIEEIYKVREYINQWKPPQFS